MRSIRRAAPEDADRLRDLLVRLDLRPEGIFAPDSAYWVVEAPSGDLIGAIGVETGEDAALLRSAGVLPTEAAWRFDLAVDWTIPNRG